MTKSETYSTRKKPYVPPKIEIIFKNENRFRLLRKITVSIARNG